MKQFCTSTEQIILVNKYKGDLYPAEIKFQPYVTASDFANSNDLDKCWEILRHDKETNTLEDVSEEVAKAILRSSEAEFGLPEFVKQFACYDSWLAEQEDNETWYKNYIDGVCADYRGAA